MFFFYHYFPGRVINLDGRGRNVIPHSKGTYTKKRLLFSKERRCRTAASLRADEIKRWLTPSDFGYRLHAGYNDCSLRGNKTTRELLQWPDELIPKITGHVWFLRSSLLVIIRKFTQRRRRRPRKRQKSNRFRQAKQQLCTCITLFCTFLCRRCTTTSWNCLISRFVEDREQKPTTFFLMQYY